MKRQLIALATGTLLSFGVLLPSFVNAQTQSVFPIWDGIELNQDQDQELAILRQSIQTQVEQILTPAQVEALQKAWQEQQNLRGAIANLNLTTAQRQELRSVFQSARTQFSDILTPEQQEQLRNNIREITQQL